MIDHLNKTTIRKIAYEKPTIKFVVGSTDLINILLECGIRSKNIFALVSNKWYDLGMLKVRLERVSHDVPNHLCKFEIDNKKGIYIVDCDSVDNVKAKDYDLYLIENNYQENILNQHIEECEDKNKLFYLERVKRTHLSKSKCDSFLIENMGKNSTYEYIHLSNYNNTKDGDINARNMGTY